jgi:hypothetical protein
MIALESLEEYGSLDSYLGSRARQVLVDSPTASPLGVTIFMHEPELALGASRKTVMEQETLTRGAFSCMETGDCVRHPD